MNCITYCVYFVCNALLCAHGIDALALYACIYIPQRGVQWKQGVVVYIRL